MPLGRSIHFIPRRLVRVAVGGLPRLRARSVWLKCISTFFDCCYEFAVAPSSSDESAPLSVFEDEDEAYDAYNSGGATDLVSAMVALLMDG